jgi:ABC-type phosphate/phosphonate transport system ATPase subunit
MAAILIIALFDVAVFGLWLTWKLLSRRKHRDYATEIKLSDKSKLLEQSNVDLCDGFARSRGGLKPFEFEFNNLSLELPAKKKKILEAVTGKIEPGTVTAVLGASPADVSAGLTIFMHNILTHIVFVGPSGAGKTSFLNTLMGKVDSSWKRGGALQINGDEAEMTNFKKLIGYVPQDDVMHRELNVWQNLKFSADMRLPSTWTAEQRERHIEAVLHALHLTDVKYTRIGDEAERGVSGGQRKRVNIGIELAAGMYFQSIVFNALQF